LQIADVRLQIFHNTSYAHKSNIITPKALAPEERYISRNNNDEKERRAP
jgi:hypothetical protein